MDPPYAVQLSFSDTHAEVVIPSKSLSSSINFLMSSIDFDSSSKDFDVASPSMASPRSVLPKAWVPPRVDMVDLVSGMNEKKRGRTRHTRRIRLWMRRTPLRNQRSWRRIPRRIHLRIPTRRHFSILL